MRTLRLGLLLLTAFAAFPLLAQCMACQQDVQGCWVCEHTYYNGALNCWLQNGEHCTTTDPCEGAMGERCTPENPESCVVHRTDLFDSRELTREWQLVAVKVERPQRNPRS